MKHPYSEMKSYQRFQSAVTGQQLGEIDWVPNPKFQLRETDSIVTMGSCFAQHITNFLRENGFNWVQGEHPSESDSEAVKDSYSTYSARYGNVYTIQQALQLLNRALGLEASAELNWLSDGRNVDPYRPNATPENFQSLEQMHEDRIRHLNLTRKIIEDCDCLILTLGLTEGWVHLESGHVFPVAPGVIAGSYNPNEWKFKNFSYEEVRDSLIEFLERLSSVNPKIKIILTVSPVFLAATYENENVVLATMRSKSVIRSVIDDVAKRYQNIQYFPSFEIVFAPWYQHSFFSSDFRNVTKEGVNTVMSIFARTLLFSKSDSSIKPSLNSQAIRKAREIICDEEFLISTEHLETSGKIGKSRNIFQSFLKRR